MTLLARQTLGWAQAAHVLARLWQTGVWARPESRGHEGRRLRTYVAQRVAAGAPDPRIRVRSKYLGVTLAGLFEALPELDPHAAWGGATLSTDGCPRRLVALIRQIAKKTTRKEIKKLLKKSGGYADLRAILEEDS